MTRRLVFVLTALLVLLAAPAYAHGGPIKLEVQGDGGQGVTATVTYQNDGHYVTGQVDMTVTAVAQDGHRFGPVKMVASAEGQSFYVSDQPLPVGAWTVTVSATQPSAAQKTVSVTSKVAQGRPTTTVSTDNGPSAILIIIGFVVLVGAGCAVLLLRRRREPQATH
ncbi:hypothetical protein ACFQ1S_09555 [Kibdelosporangium lantanae]|uniref:Uncharacterized protein n=1 Tax=Kibdelosporangium lantanae TaxID=1497396 RepID=A0ABW3M521_9PSEU